MTVESTSAEAILYQEAVLYQEALYQEEATESDRASDLPWRKVKNGGVLSS